MLRPCLLLMALAFGALPAAATNKCVAKSGKVTYQEDKCPDGATSGAVQAPRPASPGRASPADDQDDGQLEAIAWAVSSMERCSALSPQYARNAAKVMEAYRREHARSFARFEHTKQYQEILRDNRARTAEIMKAKDPALREEIANHCGTLKPQPVAGSSAGARGGDTAKGLSADVDHAIDVEAAFNVCAHGVPGWFEKMRGPYEAWAKRNFALLSRIHGDYQLEKEYQSRSARRSVAEPGLCTNVATLLHAK